MRTYYEPVFKLYVSAFIEKDPEKAKRIAERKIGESLDMSFDVQAKTIDYQTKEGGQRILMWFRENDLSLLAHELVHVIEFCFERRRIPFNLEASENIAYYMEYWFGKFEPLFRKRK